MNMSEQIDKISEALWGFQSEVTDLHKDKQGYGYKYADLSQVLEIARPLLHKYELAITQLLCSEGELIGVKTMLMHRTGQYMWSAAYMPVQVSLTSQGKQKMSLAQEGGSVVSYLRRYAYAAILGLTQVDNDAAVERPVQSVAKIQNNGVVNPLVLQLNNLVVGDTENSTILNKTLNKYKVKSPGELPEQTLVKLLDHMTANKEAANV